MVRFKNRYLLVEVTPFKQEDVSVYAKPPKKARLMDALVADKPPASAASDQPDPTLLSGLTSSNVASYIRQSIESNFGIHMAACSTQSLSVKYCNTQTGMVLVRAPRDQVETVWASLTFLTSLPAEVAAKKGDLRCAWRVVHVSGTMRSAQKTAIRMASRKIQLLLDTCTDEAMRKDLERLQKESESIVRALPA